MIIKHELPRDAVGIQCDCQAGYQQQGDELRTHRGVSKTVNAQYRHCVHNCTGTWSCTVQHSPATPLPKSFRGTAHVIALVPLHRWSLRWARPMEETLKPFLGYFFPGECYHRVVGELNFLDGAHTKPPDSVLCTWDQHLIFIVLPIGPSFYSAMFEALL